MRKFWGFYDNGTYRVGCNGASIWVYDQNDVLLKKFSDIPYAYCGVFQPGRNVFVAKSTEGRLAIYDLDNLTCLKKFRFGFDGGQDENLVFNRNGQRLYNIQHPDSLETELAIYNTDGYQLEKKLFSDDKLLELSFIENDSEDDTFYILGYMRHPECGVILEGYIGHLVGEELAEVHTIPEERYNYLDRCKSVERSGFTEKSIELMNNPILNETPTTKVSLKDEFRTG